MWYVKTGCVIARFKKKKLESKEIFGLGGSLAATLSEENVFGGK